MSDRYDDDFDDDDLELDNDPEGNKVLNKLRKDRNALKKRVGDLEGQVTESAAAARELAFLKAGIPIEKFSEPTVSDFIKAYDGDQTPEAIRQAAEARGFIAAPQAADEVAAHAAADQVAAGGSSETKPDQVAEAIAKISDPNVPQEEALAAYQAAGGRLRGVDS